MKKILFIAIFLLQVTCVFADSFLDTYPNQAFLSIYVDSKWVSSLMGYTGKDNEMSKAYKEVCACCKERVSLDLEKDIDKIGAYLIQGEQGVDVLGVISGKFNTNTLISLAKDVISKSESKSIKIEEATINGKKVQCLLDENFTVAFYSDEIILFGKESLYNVLTKNLVTFGKAPKPVTDFIEKTKCFLYITKSAVMFLAMLQLPPELISNIDSIVGYVDNEMIKIEFACGDATAAEKMQSELEKKRQEYASSYKVEFEKNTKDLNDLGMDKLPMQIILLYSSAKGKDFIDAIKFSTDSDRFVIQTKADPSEIAPGLLGLVSSVVIKLMPAFGGGMGGPGRRPRMGGGPVISGGSAESKKYSCYSNQRVLLGATEMYNMDHAEMMETLDIEKLLKEKYIKGIVKPEPQCEYESVGDLSKDGYIQCKFHGRVPESNFRH